MRGPTQGCAKYLSTELGLPPASAVLAMLPTQDLTGASAALRECLAGGTAFHNTNLLRAEREAIERGYRARDGEIHILAATTTLAAGINTPASTVVLAENEFIGEDGRAFTVAEYKNMAGRAGRLGYNEVGKAIILAETPIERAQLFQKYVLGIPEDVKSSFQERDLPTWTLRLLSQVRSVRQSEIPGLLVNTFAGYSASRVNPKWVPSIEAQLTEFMARLVQAGLADQEGDVIYLTLLGRACGASSLSFESALRLVELMKSLNPDQTPPVSLIATVQVLAEMDAVYTPLMKRGRSESARISDASRRYGAQIVSLLQRYCGGEFEFWARCKRAALLWDWLEGTPIETLEKSYTANPFQGVVSYGDVIRIAEATRFHLRSAHQILSTLLTEHPDFLTSLDTILKRLEFGLPEAAMALTKLPTPLTRGQYIALWQTGCVTYEEVVQLSGERLIACVGPAAAQLLKVADNLPLIYGA